MHEFLSSLYRRVGAALLFVSANTLLSADPPSRPIPPAPGPHIHLTSDHFQLSQSFRSSERIVGTYYFYWYDVYSKSHILDHDGTDALTTHPPSLDDFSYQSVRWHKEQLADMIAAGIDLVLPVFWGAPSEHEKTASLHWSYAGLSPLVQAREELLNAGKNPPRIGLFYDTSTLRHNRWREHVDLTTEYGQRWFYATIRDFFSLIPPEHWAMIDGRPVVLLYSAAFAKDHNQDCIAFAKREFSREFAGRIPYIAREISWRVTADNTVAWGGALGLRNPGIAALGPGYDHSAVPGRSPLIVDRRNGAFYEENWLKLLRRPANFVMIETWNEFHEGTDICESKEYGRQYIELTRKYVDLFKSGWTPPWPKGSYSDAQSVAINLGAENQDLGIRQIENEDGVTTAATLAGRACRTARPGGQGHQYIYFAVDDSFKAAGPMQLHLEVDYFDAAPGRLGLEFDGSDLSAPFAGAYTRSAQWIDLIGSKTWRHARFQLDRARLLNSQNRGADFRLVVQSQELAVSKVRLYRG